MNSPRVILVFEYPTISGGENSLLSILPNLKLQFEPVVLVPCDSPLVTACAQLGIPSFTYEFRPQSAHENDVHRESCLLNLVTTFKPEIIHGNSLSMGKFLGRRAEKLNCLLTTHIRDIIKLSQSEVKTLARCQKIICVSQSTTNNLVAHGIPPEQLSVIYNGISNNFHEFMPTSHKSIIREELGIPVESHLMLSVGQIGLRKGTHLLLDAFSSLADNVMLSNWHLLIIGSRFSNKDESIAYEHDLHAKVLRYGLASKVHLMNYRGDVANIMGRSDMLVHCPLQEPFGRVLLEAALARLPIISTNVGGTPEMLDHNQSAILVLPGNSQALATAMIHLINHPQLRSQLGHQAYDKVSKTFTIEKAAQGLMEIWHNLLEEQL